MRKSWHFIVTGTQGRQLVCKIYVCGLQIMAETFLMIRVYSPRLIGQGLLDFPSCIDSFLTFVFLGMALHNRSMQLVRVQFKRLDRGCL